jgi:hypothetical protein
MELRQSEQTRRVYKQQNDIKSALRALVEVSLFDRITKWYKCTTRPENCGHVEKGAIEI